MSLDLRQLDSACTDCIKSYKGKHKAEELKGKFHVVCTGIPKEYSKLHLPLIQDGIKKDAPNLSLSPEVLLDPVRWAAEVLDWHCIDLDGAIWKRKTREGTLGDVHPYIEPEGLAKALEGKSPYHRPYQNVMLRCSSSRKVFRTGRQCIQEDEFVYTNQGVIRAKDVSNGLEILGGTCRWAHVFEDQLLQIVFFNGIKIKVNRRHPFFTRQGWVEAGDLTKQDWVQFNYLQEPTKPLPVELDVAKLLGYLLSDGYYGEKQSTKFTNNNLSFIEEVYSIVQRHFGLPTSRRPKNAGWDLHLVNKHGTSAVNPITSFLKELGVWEKDTFGKILSFSNTALQQFVIGYFNGDGYIWFGKRSAPRKGYRHEIGFAIGGSERRATEFQYILWRLGIGSVIRKEWMKKSTQFFYRVLVARKEDMDKLFSFLEQDKYKEKFQNFGKSLSSRRPAVHMVSTDVGQEVQVRAVGPAGRGRVVGWETDTHEIISYCGMRTHNTGKSEILCISMLYNLFTHEDFSILVLAPYQSQVELLFHRLENIIKRTSAITNSVKRSVKAPNYTLELYNGSMVKMFTAGTKSGGNADAVRGQRADMLLLEEADYLAQADVTSSLAVITNQPNATVLVSSTPTGKRERFYNFCNSPNWKEFYHPSHVNPNFTPELDAFYKETLLGTYNQEVLALFGEQSEGVYQASFVNAAQLDYEYKFMVREPDWTYCIGVDWNDVKVGTTIVVVGWNPKDEMFYIVDRKTVSREGWTLTEACQQIVNLNKAWRPAWIYVDRGYGAMQIEQLHKFGLDARADPKRGPAHPDAAIASIAVAYDFASKIDIKDPFTGQPTSKSAKPFLVENSMRRFEQGRIRYPSSDKQLTSELLGYIIERVTPSGIPVYKQGNEKVGDHTLDALNLALIAFTLQISDFCRPKYETRITFTGKLGDPTERQLKEIIPGLVLKPEKGPTTYWDQAKAHRPDSGRGAELDQASKVLIGPENRTPAANTKSLIGGPKLWAWPGFLRDEPPPAKRSAQPGLTGSRPKRKTF